MTQQAEALYQQAVATAKEKASICYVQRKLLISYHQAENYLERMIADGYITDYQGRRLVNHVDDRTKALQARIAELEAQQYLKQLTVAALDTRPVVSDDELAKAFAGTDFGGADHRQELHVAVLKKACGYHCGHTITTIMRELGLIGASNLPTKKGRKLISLAYHALMVGGP